MMVSFMLWFPVMEVACGEYGDVVPKLVVAMQNGSWEKNACVSEIKPINCDKSTKHPINPESQYSLRDGINVDNLLSDHNELLSVQKLEHNVCTDDANDHFSSPWKTLNSSSSDTTITSSKVVSTGFLSIGCARISGTNTICFIVLKTC